MSLTGRPGFPQKPTESTTNGALPRITLLRAPAGYGKSRALAEARHESSLRAERVGSFTCQRLTPPEFWPALVTQLATLLGVDPPAAGDDSIDQVAELITEPVTLVIERYHRATSPENDLALASLCEHAPHLTLIVEARRTHLLDGPLAGAHTRIRVVGPRELSYDLETSLALAAKAGFADSPALREALEQTDGWPIAVHAVVGSGSGEMVDPDPLENLRRFALHHLELVTEPARRFLLAAAVLDAISLDHAAAAVGVGIADAREAANELLELGLIELSREGGVSEYRCRRAVRAPLAVRALRSRSIDRPALRISRARGIERRDPATALRLLCEAGAYSEAEALIARMYMTITADVTGCLAALSGIPDAAQLAHPGIIAARIKLMFTDPAVSTATIHHLIRLWKAALTARTEGIPTERWDLPTLGQVMVFERMIGNSERAATLAAELEDRITREANHTSTDHGDLTEGFTLYHHELAVTALVVGDLDRARKQWNRLTDTAKLLIESRWSAVDQHSEGSVQTGQRLIVMAHQELAFTELLSGDFRRLAQHLREADDLAARLGEHAPRMSWVSAELARATLATELRDPEMFETAFARLGPLHDRIERWPVLLMAETNMIRFQKGTDWALAHLGAGIDDIDRGRHPAGRWREHLTLMHAGLCTTAGDLVTAERLLERMPEGSPMAAVERARFALFAGDDVQALLRAQSVSERTIVRRQAVDRNLISAAAAWGCGERETALTALVDAATLIAEFGLTSRLWGLPHDQLTALAEAAAAEGLVDLRDLIAAVPPPARGFRYERLTEMERKTLLAVAENGNGKDAAAALFVTPGTVKKHLASVYRKLRASGRDEAVLRATRMGLLGRA